MKITFEGASLHEMIDQMESMVRLLRPKNISKVVSEKPTTTALPKVAEAQGPGPDPFTVETPVDKPVDIPVGKPARTPKQLENDERLRVRAQEKAAAKKAAKAGGYPKAAKAGDYTPPAPAPDPVVPPPKTAEGMDPAEVVRVRQKTIEDLQSAYANGFQKEVFELLSRFGNGAKSFRELPPDAFVPIREAIDNGALT